MADLILSVYAPVSDFERGSGYACVLVDEFGHITALPPPVVAEFSGSGIYHQYGLELTVECRALA